MATDSEKRLERRESDAAEAALAARGFVTAVDVLTGLGWLPPSGERAWRQGRIPYLERATNANPNKISGAGEDLALQTRCATEIRRLFPGCPPHRADAIARHAALRGSGRVGRTRAGRATEPQAVELAVIASLRHRLRRPTHERIDRAEARERARGQVDDLLEHWRRG